MRAAVFKEAGKPWVVEERPDPTPGDGEAVIKVGRCGICGTDLNMTSGKGYDFPCDTILGHEFSGEVVAIGKGVTSLKVGDRVTALPAAGCGACDMCRAGQVVMCPNMSPYAGGYAEYMRIAERTAVQLPAALSLNDGALVEPLAVGLHGVRLANLPLGAKVLVLGAGAVGLAATFWAKRLGAGRVVAASRSERRRDMALALGADDYVLTGEGEAERVTQALDGMPDYVFEAAGAVGLLQQSINLVKPNGHVISLGFCMAPDPVIPGISTFKQVKLTFSMAWTVPEFQYAVDMLDSGHVEPRHMITSNIGLDALPDMIETLRGPHNETKVHVDPWA
ncbi:alcohol dehydrogenase catalytic domain-containing protein [Sphingobium sp. HBC34]|uniref:Alcohol dehydrogenase catalytic domain-containing protein n=1 Tax=Sphingobium cyanobacteriorum TaxID=3063954 RepID=A0ABT8ZQ59_9SPHN|nr:alcohol dehydrogenase catalytic domain-containing protein [Sphingobium sp. HBC34]MDO7836685.1 alcohol dehydrogenase catalytic domain-containing protein [Sphingobium sp. HBC34]